MVGIGISRAVRGEGTDRPDGPKTWEHVRSQGRKDMYHFFYFD